MNGNYGEQAWRWPPILPPSPTLPPLCGISSRWAGAGRPHFHSQGHSRLNGGSLPTLHPKKTKTSNCGASLTVRRATGRAVRRPWREAQGASLGAELLRPATATWGTGGHRCFSPAKPEIGDGGRATSLTTAPWRAGARDLLWSHVQIPNPQDCDITPAGYFELLHFGGTLWDSPKEHNRDIQAQLAALPRTWT